MRIRVIKPQRQRLEVSGGPLRFCLAQARTSVPDRSDDGSAIVLRPVVGTAQRPQTARDMSSPAANGEIKIVLTVASDNGRESRSGFWLGLRECAEWIEPKAAESEACEKTPRGKAHSLFYPWIRSHDRRTCGLRQ